MRLADFVDHYEILGLQFGASPDDVREAWRRCARLYHPDLNPRKTSFRFRRAKDAYDILIDPQKRRDYDRLYRLNKGILSRSAAAHKPYSSFIGTPPGGRVPPPPRRPVGASGRSSSAGGSVNRPVSGQQSSARQAPDVGRGAGKAGPRSSVPGSPPSGSAEVRSRTSFRPATIFRDAKGASLIDQLKDAITQGGDSRVRIRHNGQVVWETHITTAAMDDLVRFVVGPLTALLKLIGVDEQFQIEITNELVEDYNRANALFDQGKLEEAKELYKGCINRNRYFAPAHLSLGAVYEAQKDTSVAIKCYQNTVKIDPAGEAGRFARENLRRLRGY